MQKNIHTVFICRPVVCWYVCVWSWCLQSLRECGELQQWSSEGDLTGSLSLRTQVWFITSLHFGQFHLETRHWQNHNNQTHALLSSFIQSSFFIVFIIPSPRFCCAYMSEICLGLVTLCTQQNLILNKLPSNNLYWNLYLFIYCVKRNGLTCT